MGMAVSHQGALPADPDDPAGSGCAPAFDARLVAAPMVDFDARLVAAPMVGASDLAFRLLCRRHGATLCYTEMLCADRLLDDSDYLESKFLSQTHALDRPLIVQLCGNEATVLAAAAKLVAPHCDGVDLNLGCPQKRAQERLEGAFLCDPEHWPRVFGIVRAMATALSDHAPVPLPVTCKIRLLDADVASGRSALEQTIAFARGLVDAGCSLLAIHGRGRGTPGKRRAGAADLSAVAAIVAALPATPVLTNGNVRRPSDVAAALRRTGAAGAMVGEELLIYPALFAAGTPDAPSLPARRALALEYVALAQEHPPPSLEYVRGHLSWMLGRDHAAGGGAKRLRYKFAAARFDALAVREMLNAARDSAEVGVLAMLLMPDEVAACGGACKKRRR